MDPSQWQEWLLSPRRDGWPTRVNELLPAELASFCLVIENDPDARHPLDATGFLSRERFQVLLQAFSAISPGAWLVAYWDGWSGVELTLREAFPDRLFRLQLPLREYFGVHASTDELARIHEAQQAFLGPSLMADINRTALVISDVDWSITYAGFTTGSLRTRVARAFEQKGPPVDLSCNPSAPLPGY